MVAVGFRSVSENEVGGGGAPLAGRFRTSPSPVRKIEMNSPGRAGRAAIPARLAFSAANSPPEVTIAPWSPLPIVKIPGAAAVTLSDPFPLLMPVRFTSRGTTPDGVSNGTCALICVGETNNSGAATLLIATDASVNTVGNGADANL